MTVDEVIGMISVRHRLVPAVRPVPVPLSMGAAVVVGGALRRILAVHRDLVLVHMASMGSVEVTVVQVIRVPLVDDCGVPAIRTMLMRVPFVCLVCHAKSPSE